ncbi:MAG: hypothetical protein Q8R47_01470 [Nanoarchaeota archaeon]|nr:hypothetical protein [Nanoarchaeota archaeon]
MAVIEGHQLSWIVWELDRYTIKQGLTKSFYDQHNYVALELAQQHGLVLTLPELLQARSLLPFDDLLWRIPITAQTEEIIGKTKQGNPVAIVVHGSGLLTPERIIQGVEEGLTRTILGKEQYAVRLQEKEVQSLLDGNTFWNDIEVYTYSEFSRAVPNHLRRYAIVRDLELQKIIFPEKQSFRTWSALSSLQCYAGGEENLCLYLEMLELYCKHNQVEYRPPYNYIDADIPQGRLLQVHGLVDMFNHSMEMDGPARFLAVKPEHLQEKIDKEILIEVP